MKAEARNVRVNIASYYVDIHEEAMLFFRDNFEIINRLLPKEVASVSSSSDSENSNTLIVTTHSKNMNEQAVINLINGLFEKDDVLYINKYEHLEKQVVELLSVTGCGNVLDAIEYVKTLQSKGKVV